MEEMECPPKKWNFVGNQEVHEAASKTLRGVVTKLMGSVNPDDPRTILPLAHGDPAVFPVFRTSLDAENAIVDALRTGEYNCYSPGDGVEEARRALAKYLNRDLTNKLTGDDIFFAVGCNQAIEIILTVLQRPGANILLPRPGFPHYEARAVFSQYEARHFDLLPEKDWEIDLEGIEALADENTVALVIINPNNPCGNVYTYEHLKKVAETARRLGVMVISDEVYDHCIYGCSPFVPMGKFSSIVPVLTLGALSKGWYVPGWRLGWMAMNDPYGVFKRTGVVDSIRSCQYITPDAVTFLQAALPGILNNTKEEFFKEKLQLLRENLDFALDKIRDMPALTCVKKPESCTYLLLKMNLSMLEDIEDDHDFCVKLAKEEAVIVLPGDALGLKNWLRISLGVDRSVLEDGLERLKAYYDRHAAARRH